MEGESNWVRAGSKLDGGLLDADPRVGALRAGVEDEGVVCC